MIEVNYNDYKRILEENMRLIPENHKLKEEIEKLNNIINELEKYFEQEGFWHSLDKIKELKGSNGVIPPETIGTNGEDGGLFDYGDR